MRSTNTFVESSCKVLSSSSKYSIVRQILYTPFQYKNRIKYRGFASDVTYIFSLYLREEETNSDVLRNVIHSVSFRISIFPNFNSKKKKREREVYMKFPYVKPSLWQNDSQNDSRKIVKMQ